MPETYRRVFCRPEGLTDEQRSQWERALADAISLQRQIESTSHHVLRYVGSLQMGDTECWIEHEPADLIAPNAFDRSGTPIPPGELLRAASGLFDALKACHESRRERPPAHGGICPGVLLVTSEGLVKVSDFGVAPTYASLGLATYKSLACRTDGASPGGLECTGAWEVLSNRVRDRDDRFVGFIDPDQFGGGSRVETGLDLFSAGVLLHLLAERRHPYFADEPEAHRDPAIAEDLLLMGASTSIRRADLVRADADPAIRVWRELVRSIVESGRDSRPSAAEAVAKLPRLDSSEILRARLDKLARFINTPAVRLDDLVPQLRRVAEDDSLPPDLREQSAAMLDVCQASAALESDAWPDAEALLARAQSAQALPASLSRKVTQLGEQLQVTRAGAQALQSARYLIEDASGSPMDREARLSDAMERLGAIDRAGLPAFLVELIQATQEECDNLRAELTGQLTEAIEEARAWNGDATVARGMGDWESLRDLLQRKPRYLPDDVKPVADQLARDLATHDRLTGVLATAQTLFRKGQLLDAQDKASEVQRECSDETLAQAAADLLEQIGAAARERAAHEAELLAERARLDQRLKEARAGSQAATVPELTSARDIAEEVAASEKAADAQRSSARELIGRINRKIGEVEKSIFAELEELESSEQNLARCGELLEKGRLDEALKIARELVHSKYPHVADMARDFETRAQEQIADRQERERLARELRETLADIGRGEIRHSGARLRELAESDRLSTSDQRAARDVVASMTELELIAAALEQQDYPGAIELTHLLEGPGIAEPARRAAATLAEKARSGLSTSLLAGLEKHLEHRAKLEETQAELAGVSPDESLGGASPDWLRSDVSRFDTFIQDCSTGAGGQREPQFQNGYSLGGKYEIQEFLGRGGMGEVYRALDTKLKREVALKIGPAYKHHAQFAVALEREAEAIASLEHDHILHINSFHVIEDRPCFDMEYARGRNLADHAAAIEMSPRQAAELLLPICNALATAHARGVLHRDIKPENIYVAQEGSAGPWLLDFGLARIRTICDQRELQGLCGTPGYIAPEVIRSLGRDAGPQSDVFAMGCVLYSLLAKQTPFRGSKNLNSGPSRTLLQTIRYQVDPLSALAPNVPSALRAICEKAMAADPRRRYQSAKELGEALARFARELDREEAETSLEAAAKHYENRRKSTPEELADLVEAEELAERARDRNVEPVRSEAAALIEQIRRTRQQIGTSIADSKKRLEEAKALLARQEAKAAQAAAEAVVTNPYAPDLHGEARELIAQASALGKRKTGKRAMIVVGGVVAAGIAGGAFLFMPREPKASPRTSNPTANNVTSNGATSSTPNTNASGGGTAASDNTPPVTSSDPLEVARASLQAVPGLSRLAAAGVLKPASLQQEGTRWSIAFGADTLRIESATPGEVGGAIQAAIASARSGAEKALNESLQGDLQAKRIESITTGDPAENGSIPIRIATPLAREPIVRNVVPRVQAGAGGAADQLSLDTQPVVQAVREAFAAVAAQQKTAYAAITATGALQLVGLVGNTAIAGLPDAATPAWPVAAVAFDARLPDLTGEQKYPVRLQWSPPQFVAAREDVARLREAIGAAMQLKAADTEKLVRGELDKAGLSSVTIRRSSLDTSNSFAIRREGRGATESATFVWDPESLSFKGQTDVAEFITALKSAFSPVTLTIDGVAAQGSERVLRDGRGLSVSVPADQTLVAPTAETVAGLLKASVDGGAAMSLPASYDAASKKFTTQLAAMLVRPGATISVQIGGEGGSTTLQTESGRSVQGGQFALVYEPNWLRPRREWEQGATAQQTGAISGAAAAGMLARWSAIKSGRPDVTIASLGARGQTVGDELNANVSVGWQIPLTWCAEYLWGGEFVHVLCWRPAGDVQSATYARIPVAQVWSALQTWRDQASDDGTLGRLVLPPALPAEAFRSSEGSPRAIGIALAPDGPLCGVPLLSLTWPVPSFSAQVTRRNAATTSEPTVVTLAGGGASLAEALTRGENPVLRLLTAAWILPSLGPGKVSDEVDKSATFAEAWTPFWNEWGWKSPAFQELDNSRVLNAYVASSRDRAVPDTKVQDWVVPLARGEGGGQAPEVMPAGYVALRLRAASAGAAAPSPAASFLILSAAVP